MKPVTSRSDIESRRAYARWHYRQNKESYKARAAIKTKQMRQEIAVYLLEYLKAHPCVDCGEDDPIVLEFDHREGEDKLFALGDARRNNYSLRMVKTEVAKCEVRCANCHRRITYRRAGRTHRG